MYLKTLVLGLIGVSSVAGFAPSAAPALRNGVTSVNLQGANGPPTWRNTNINQRFYTVPYDPKTAQNFDVKEALGLKDDVVDKTYQKPASTFNFGGAAKPAARQAAPAPAKKAAPAARQASARAGTGRLGSARR
mmetsp:Transcript_25205/g.51275  ORF Transcript_25205/g.51275 Transcript_25205/m.51275 type:complete len:134 (+) Transcript_25205:54-455(+)|eukprot:CAMPEP_0181294576 /NCGR_PEP_ID=MMETSP1101-20121128/3680_1 /TAXON_ID=46948 /ORGANISM="Rhodomonas abbreviata, Strain Caron Lab Isolate" /LENGTH=133 /DNA_ID=CAMNT_0023399255 /DNA_START=33 /DNA_END=434 /DNA_ORIENTATION=+